MNVKIKRKRHNKEKKEGCWLKRKRERESVKEERRAN